MCYNEFMFSFYWPWIKQTFGLAKKILLVIIVFFAIISFFLYFIAKDRPQTTKSSQITIQKNRESLYKVLNDPELNSTKEGKTVVAVYRIIMCGLIGEACTNNPSDAEKNYHQSLAGFMTNLLVLPYNNPPASGIYWVRNSLENAGFIPKSYAAEGVGFGAIKSLSNLWKLFRDIAYMLLVLVLVIIGFMIMFRMKLNPQTVISVENALPKIVISLLLITFSFAIAGFLIDLMYVVIALSISLLSKNILVHINVQEYQNAFIGGDSWFLFGKLANVWGIGDALFAFLPGAVAIVLKTIIMLVFFVLIGKMPIIGPLLNGNMVQGAAETGNILSWLMSVGITPVRFGISFVLGLVFSPLIISFFVWLTAILIFMRIFLALFKAYIEIILLVIFSPVILLLEAVPGKGSFSFWIKHLVADLVGFPIVVILMIIGTILIYIPSTGANLWAAPFMPDINTQNFSVLIGIGLMYMIPDIIKMAKEALGVKGGATFGPGMFFGAMSTTTGGTLGLLSQFGSISLAIPALSRLRKYGVMGITDPQAAEDAWKKTHDAAGNPIKPAHQEGQQAT